MGRVCRQHIYRIWRNQELHEDTIAHEYQDRNVEGSYECTSSTRHALVESFLDQVFLFLETGKHKAAMCMSNTGHALDSVLTPQDGQV